MSFIPVSGLPEPIVVSPGGAVVTVPVIVGLELETPLH